jgi:antitoxin (DNA-binding transcriptional repressor) of toxin-antitoxin stability system
VGTPEFEPAIPEPASPADVPFEVVSMRCLNQNTAAVIDGVATTGRITFVTKRNRVVAVIRPLPPAIVESAIANTLATYVEELRHPEI